MIPSPTNSKTATINPGELIIDYAYPNQPQPADYNGIAAVIRYNKPYPSTMQLTKDEAARLHGMGLGILLVCEGAAGDAMQSAAFIQQRTDAYCRNADAIGYPSDLSMLFAVDYDVTGGTLLKSATSCKIFQQQCMAHGRFHSGIYGDFDIIDSVGRTFESSNQVVNGWSHKQVSGFTSMLQHVSPTGRFDLNTVVKPFQVWYPHSIDSTQQQPINIDKETNPMFKNSEPFRYNGTVYDPAVGRVIVWRYNDAGQTIHIDTTQEVMARGGYGNAQPFTNAELAQIGIVES